MTEPKAHDQPGVSLGYGRVERPTLRSVAALAGVGKSTVSRVFNSDPTVSPDIVERVRNAAAQLNYYPNRAASDLRRRDGRPSTIGLLIEDVSNVFYATIFRAVEDVAAQHGVTVLASNLDDDPAKEHKVVTDLISRRVSGLIIDPASYDHSYLQHQQRSGTPVVFLDRAPLLLAADSIVSDCQVGAYKAVKHLVEFGHRRIGFLGESTAHAPAPQRYAGYVQALQEANIAIDERLVRRDTDSEEAAAAACTEILSSSDPPTAFFTAFNQATLGAIRVYYSLGCEETHALVGFDDFPLFDRLKPAISTVAQDPRTMGTIAAEVLFERIWGDCTPPKQHIVETKFIARGSGEIRPRASKSRAR